ncbi:histidine kinase [Streptomyces sp. HPF1205]|uniref:sensor histidine kinase n=1 Tax=Streptomyces sp. HPF1205 TaxID=2873262 RepID=UPI001CED5FA2|nr:histidine kinase [Streptomyces sp. HPF1205]
MSGTRTDAGPRARRWRPLTRLAAGAVALGRGAVLCAVASAGAVPLLAIAAALRVLLVDGTRPAGMHGPYHTWMLLILVLLGLTVVRMRWVARCCRRLVGAWCGVEIAEPYRPAPAAGRTGGRERGWQRIGRLLSDPATWRDLLWTVINAVAGFFLLLLPMAVLGAYGLVFVVTGSPPKTPHASVPPGPPATGPLNSLLAGDPKAVVVALMCVLPAVAIALAAAPRLLTGYGHLADRLLGPTKRDRLARRVDHLAATRSDTIDSVAAEMRRIERDLHDGAQARLVAMGMTLNAAEQLFASSPQAALALVTEAKQSSVKALAELRDLVRGIHPPVLADRGLAEAVRALALDLPLAAQVDGTLPVRAPAPVESAAYFAVTELLANVTKHAGARRVWIDIGHTGEALRIGVTDDGRGGADPSRGTGLRGLERRLAAFDGVLAVSSPPGGPTIASLEIPCALSSPKTSSC